MIIDFITIFITSGNIRGELSCPAGDHHPPLSVHLYLSHYVSRTSDRRSYHQRAEGELPNRLFIANTRPYQPVTPATIARWVLSAMDKANIDTTTYKAHSARSANATHMIKRGLSVSQIMERANWSQKSGTFARFYNRD